MGHKALITIMLLVTFVVTFYVSTMIFDGVATSRGFYTPGLEESASFDQDKYCQ